MNPTDQPGQPGPDPGPDQPGQGMLFPELAPAPAAPATPAAVPYQPPVLAQMASEDRDVYAALSVTSRDLLAPKPEVDIQAAFAEQERLSALTLEETFPLRLRLCWRLVRFLAISRGVCGLDESLMAATLRLATTHPQLDPWLRGDLVGYFLARHQEYLPGDPFSAFLRQHTDPDLINHPERSIPLIPPKPTLAPYHFLDNPHPEANPTALPPALEPYFTAFHLVAHRLRVTDPSVGGDPHAGRLAMRGLSDDPVAFALNFPSGPDILLFEQLLIDRTIEQITDLGSVTARRHLTKELGLTPIEITSLLLASSETLAGLDNDLGEELERSIHLRRLEGLADRAREALDIRGELQVMKQMASVRGLERNQRDETAQDLLSSMMAVAAQNQIAAAESKKALDSARVIDQVE